MGINVANYIKNLGKSISYSAVDKFRDSAPATSEFVETNEELFKDIFSTVRDYRLAYGNAKKAFKTSKVYDTGDLLITSVFDDIKSGKLYNREREEDINEKLMGGDFSMDELDADLNMDESADMGGSSSDNIIEKSIKQSGQMNASAVSMSVARTGQYIVESQKTSTNILYSQNLQSYKMFDHHLNNLNQNMSGLLQFSNEVIKTHAENSKKFYEESTKSSQVQTQLLNQLVTLLSPSHDLQDRNNKRSTKTSYNDIIGANGTPDIKEYLRYVKTNAKNELGNYLPSNPFADEDNDTSMMMAFVSSPLKFIPAFIVSKLIPKTLDDATKKLDKSISGFFGSVISKINVMGNNPESNILAKMLGKIFGFNNDLKSGMDTSKYEKGKMSWNGIAQKSLTEVIPNQLGKIISLMSGKEEKRYDYQNGKFVTISEIKKDIDRTNKSYSNLATSDMKDEFKKYASFLTFESAFEKKEFEKDMDKFFAALYNRGGFFDFNSKDLSKSDYGVDDSKNFQILRTMFKNSDKYMQQQINGEILRQRSSQTANMKNLESTGGSVYNNLYNGSISDKDLEKIEKNKKNGLHSGIGGALNIATIMDNKGHNVFYYLQNMYKEISFIRRSRYDNDSAQSTLSPNSKRFKSHKKNNKPLQFSDIVIPDKSEKTKNISKTRENNISNEDRFQRAQDKLVGNATKYNTKLMDTSNIDDEKIDSEFSYIIQRNKLNNKLRNRTDKEKEPSLIDKLLASTSITDKTKVIIDKLNDLSKKPLQFFTKTIDKVDDRLYEVIYGKASKSGQEDPKGFINVMLWKLQNTFTKFNTWLDETILNPIKQKINKKNMKKLANGVLGVFGLDYDELHKSIHDYLFGNKQTHESGLFTNVIEGVKNSFKNAGSTVKGAFSDTFSPVINKVKSSFDKANVKKSGESDVVDDTSAGLYTTISDYLKRHAHPHAEGGDIEKPELATLSKGEKVIKASDNKSSSKEKKDNADDEESIIIKATKEFKDSMDKSRQVLFGDPSKDSKKFGEAVGDVTKNFGKYAPDAIGSGLVGAGVSLVTSAIGGPLLGAAVGAGISLTKSSSKIKNWLFGDLDEQGERKGGKISGKTQKVLKQFLPDMKRLGIVGGVAGLTPFLPFGPVAGLLIGGAAGFAKNTEVVQERMFGKAGILSDKRKDAIKKFVPKTLAALVPSLFLGPFGILGNAVLGTGLGLLSNTKGFEKAVFGTYNVATKRNENGLLPMVRNTVVNPVKKFYNKMSNTLFDWVQEKVMKPVETAIAPVGKQLELILKGVFTGVGKHIDKMFEKAVGVPLSRLIEDKIAKPITKVFGKVFNGILKPVKFMTSLPFKAIGGIGNSLRNRQVRNGTADYMSSQERIDYRKTHDMRSLGQKIKSKLAGPLSGPMGIDQEDQTFNFFDKIINGMDEDKLSNIYNGINTIRDSRGAAEKKRQGIRDEVGNQVSGYLGNYGLSVEAMKSINKGNFESARGIITNKRATEKKTDAQVINKLNKYISGQEGTINSSKFIDYIKNRIEDPEVSKKMLKLVSEKKYEDLLKLIKAEEKKKDEAQESIISFVNSKAKDYEQSKYQKATQGKLEKDAYSQLSELGIQGIDKYNAQKYLDLINSEMKGKKAKTETIVDAEGNKEEVKVATGIKDLTDQDKKQHEDIMKVINDAVDNLKKIKESLTSNSITKYNKSDSESVLDADMGNKKFVKNASKNLSARNQMTNLIKNAEKRKKQEDESLKDMGLNPGDTVGQNYNGGVVKKTGVMTASKGEYTYTPENTDKMMNAVPYLLQKEVEKKPNENTIIDLVSQAVDKLDSIDDNTNIEDKELDKPVTKIDNFGNVMKFKKVRNGDLEPDTSDTNTKEALIKSKEGEDTQKGILSKLSNLSSIFDPLKQKKKDKDDKKDKKGLLSKLLTLFGASGLLGKLALGLGASAVVGGAGKFFTNTEAGKEVDAFWNKDLQPWLEKKAWPTFRDKVIPAISDGIKYALTDGMPYIVQGIASSVKFAITKMYPALLKAVLAQLGLSGKNGEESLPGNVAYATSRSVLANGGRAVTKFAEKYASSEGAKATKAIPKLGETIMHPIRSTIKGLTGATKEGAKVGTKGLSKVASVIAKPIVAIEKTIDNTKLFNKFSSLKETSNKITEKGLNATINLSESLKKKAGISAVKDMDKATEKTLEKTASKGLISSFIKTFQEGILKILGSSPVVALVGGDGAEKLSTKFVPRFIEGISKQIESKGVEVTAKLAASASTAGIINIAYAVQGFVSGWNNARSVLGITDEPTTAYKVVAGLMEAISSAFIITSLIPSKLIVDLAVDIILPLFGVSNTKLQQQRKDAQKEVDAYNKNHKTNYDIEQYNKEVKGDKSLWQKFKNGVSNNYKYVKNGITNNLKYVGNQIGKGVDFVKQHGVVGTMEYIAGEIGDTVEDMLNAVGKKISPIVKYFQDLGSYEQSLGKSALDTSWNLDWSGYWRTPNVNNSPVSGFKKFLFYTNRILGAPAYGMIALGRGIYDGAKTVIQKFEDLATYGKSLSSSGIDTAWNLDWSGYWRTPVEEGTPVSGFKKFLFYTNRILGAPVYGTIALGGAVYAGIKGVVNEGKDLYGDVSKDNDNINNMIDSSSDSYWTIPEASGSFSGFKRFMYGVNRVIHAPSYYIHKLINGLDLSSIKDKIQSWMDQKKTDFENGLNGQNSNTGNGNNPQNPKNPNNTPGGGNDGSSSALNEVGKFVYKVDQTAQWAKNGVTSAVSTVTSDIAKFIKNNIPHSGGQPDGYLTPEQYRVMTTNPKYIKNPDLVYTLKGFNPLKTTDTIRGMRKSKSAGMGGGSGAVSKYIRDPNSVYDNPHNRFRNVKQIIRNNSSRGIGGSDMSQFKMGTDAISDTVEGYRSTVDKLKGSYGVNDTDLVLALIMQESGGDSYEVKHDCMQASESLGKSPNSLSDPTESIKAGLTELGQCLAKSGGDIPLSLQGYNYGSGFIDYAKSHGGVWTQAVANEFSDSHNHGGGYGDKQYVQHVLRYYHGDGSNGGNGSTDGSASSKPTLSNMMSDFDTMITHAQNRFFGFDDSSSSDSSGGTSGGGGSSVDVSGGSPAVDWFKKTMGATETSGYGPRKGLDAGGFHYGIDMSAAAGTKIETPIGGVVAANQGESESGGFGNAIYIKDKNGNYNIFGHMAQRSPLSVGQKVNAGTVVGEEGSTGHSTGPHVHYEVRKGSMAPGNSTDPNAYLKQYYEGSGPCVKPYTGGQITQLAVKSTMEAMKQEKDHNVDKKEVNNPGGVGGQTTTVYGSDDILTKLINTIITILTKIADNTANLSSIVKVISSTTGTNVSKEQLQKLDTTGGKAQLASALKQNLLTDSDTKLTNQKILQIMDSLAKE